MSCGCNNSSYGSNPYSSACCPDIPYPSLSHESVPSLIDNLVEVLYGGFYNPTTQTGYITKSVQNGRVVWNIPCDPNNTSEIQQIPRNPGEGLLCYLIRVFNSIASIENNLVTLTGTQTLTNKTLAGAVFSGNFDLSTNNAQINGGTFNNISIVGGTSNNRTLTNATLATPTVTGTATLTGATLNNGTFANSTLNTPTVNTYLKYTPQNTSPTSTAGASYYDSVADCLAYNDSIGETQINRQTIVRALNNTGSDIAVGQAVYINGSSGNPSYPTIALAQANSLSTSAVVGVTRQIITASSVGQVVLSGVVQNVNTSSFTAGTDLYLSATTPGALVSVSPTNPNYSVQIGVCVQQATSGSLLVVPAYAGVPAANVVGTLNLAQGGTNANLTAVTGGVAYSSASAIALTAAGTSTQALIGGTSPTWSTSSSSVKLTNTAKAWYRGTISAATLTQAAAYGCSVSRTGTGAYSVTLANNSDANYAVVFSFTAATSLFSYNYSISNSTTFTFTTYVMSVSAGTLNQTATDLTSINFVVYGN